MNPLALFLLSFFQLTLSVPQSVAQQAPSSELSSPSQQIRVSSNLVLVPVVALDLKTGLPDQTLQREDFAVFDNDRPVSISSFDSGASARRLTLWFVVQCSMQDFSDAEGSGFFRGQVHLFAPALKSVDKRDTVAVAHWCDNGDATVDLPPTSNVDDVSPTLERVLAPSYAAADHDRTGELALQKTLQLIVDATRSLAPEPVPVIVFLYGDHSGMPKSEADHFIGELLETSAIAFGLKDRRSHFVLLFMGEQKEVAHYIAAQTGGQYFAATPETYASSLQTILQQLHFRYELGFTPAALDGKRHNLRVTLASSAKRQHRGLRLRYRLAYVPAPPR